MPSSYSTNLKIELQATGENSGTWGTITNTNLGTALEQAVVGYGNPSYPSDANLTLTYTDTNAAQAARALVLNVTSAVSLSATRELVVPTIQKQYIVQNNTSGSQSITVKTSAGTGITVPNGRKAHLYVNGTDVIFMDDFVDINGGSIDGTTIGANSAAAGNFTTVDTTNIEVTNLKAKDGTTAGSIADATGVVTLGSSVLTTTDINGGTIDGTTIGGSSAAAGTFTTLTTSSTVTLNGGNLAFTSTAQRLTADMSNGTVSNRFAFQTSTTNGNTQVNAIPNGTSTASQFIAYNNADPNNASSIQMTALSSSTRLLAGQTGTGTYLPLTFFTNGSEQARIETSGNFGIGTASPATKLNVVGTVTVDGVVDVNGGQIDLDTGQPIRWGGAASSIYAGSGTSDMVFTVGSSERFRVNGSTGNLGIGTASPTQKLEVAGSGNAFVSNGQAIVSAGSGITYSARLSCAYNFPFVDTYLDSVAGASYSGQIIFRTSSGGGAMTERMRLDASGNLGLGVTPSAWGGGYKSLDILAYGSVAVAGGTFQMLTNAFYNGTNYIYKNTAAASDYYQNAGTHVWRTAPSGTAGNAISFTQAMTLDASGNLGVGTASPGQRLHISGGTSVALRISATGNAASGLQMGFAGSAVDTFLSNTEAGNLIFGTSNTERARITSGGDFGIGNTNPLYRLTVDKDTTSALAFFTNSNATAPNGAYIDFSASSPNNATQYFLYCEDSTAQRATIRSNGGLANYSANNVNLASDERLKKDISVLATAWDKVKDIEVVNYRYKDCNEGDPLLYGVIAQQVQPIVPELVVVTREATETDPEYYGIREQPMYWLAIKALQEAMTKIETLEAKVTALESK